MKDCFNPDPPSNDCQQFNTGSSYCFGTGYALPDSYIAMVPGKPQGVCTATDKETSLAVGGDVGSVNKNNTFQERQITDINMLYTYGNPSIVNNQTVVSQQTFLGFYYYDNGGALWFQKSDNVGWNVSLSAGLTLGGFFESSLNITPPSQNDPIYLGSPSSSMVAPHTFTRACFSEGSTYLSNALD